MDETKIEAAVLAAAREEDGLRQLSCARAQVLAEDLGVTPRTVGAVCQRLGVRLTDCQLGCFGKGRNKADRDD